MTAMTETIPRDSERTRGLPRFAAFVVAACSFVFVFATAGTPIPLFNTYRVEEKENKA
jgi:hypothetical protein